MQLTNLATVRKARGMTQCDLADATGLTPAAISHLETGRRNARPSTTRLLAMLLYTSVEDLTADPVNEPVKGVI